MAVTMLNLLQIFLVVVGLFSTLWGIYDLFGDSGSQSSMGVKKIIGGIAFACIAYFVMSWAKEEVGKAESEAGIATTSVTYANMQDEDNDISFLADFTYADLQDSGNSGLIPLKNGWLVA